MVRRLDRIGTHLDDAKEALWCVRLRGYKGIGCWCLNMQEGDYQTWLDGKWTHDHRCRKAQKVME